MNTTSNTYHFNGKIKTHTLRLNRVSGTNGTMATIADGALSDSFVSDSGNFHSKIQVKSINGADWDSFVSSLYRKGRNTPINGKQETTSLLRFRRMKFFRFIVALQETLC